MPSMVTIRHQIYFGFSPLINLKAGVIFVGWEVNPCRGKNKKSDVFLLNLNEADLKISRL